MPSEPHGPCDICRACGPQARPTVPRRKLLLGALKGGVVALTATVAPALATRAAAAAGPAATSAQNLKRHAVVRASRLKVGSAFAFDNPFTGAPAYLVQPRHGEFRAFSRLCTHAGCTVAFAAEKFLCPCHGSQFSAVSGTVLRGPAQAPLPRYPLVVKGGMVYVEP